MFLFAADAVLNDDREVIYVEPATIEYLSAQREELLARELSEAERAAVVEEYIDEEVLVREAYLSGLDRSGRIRRQLLKQIRFLLAEDLPEPTEAELRAFHAEHPDFFRIPSSVTIDQVFYQDADVAPSELPAILETGADPAQLGEFHMALGRHVPDTTERDLAFILGGDAARRIFTLAEGQWSGPIASRLGVHFVRIVDRLPERTMSYERFADYARNKWALEKHRQSLAKKVAEMRRRYRVVVGEEAGR